MEEIHGRWWQAGADSGEAVPGVLTIDDKRLDLKLHELMPIQNDEDLIVIGESMEHAEVTLLDATVLRRQYTSHHGGGASEVSATRVLVGAHIEDPETALFDRIQIELQNMTALRNESGWKREVEFGRDRYGLEWTPVPKLSCTTPRGEVDLVIWMREHSVPEINTGDYRVGEVGYFDIRLAEPMSIERSLDLWFRPLIDFTSFAAGTACAVTSVQVSGPDFQERGYPSWIDVRSNWGNNHTNDFIDFWQARFTLPDNDSDFGSLMCNWLELHEKAARPLSGFFVNEWDRTAFMENRFLTAAVALEGYHRRTTPRAKINFGARITESCHRAAPKLGCLITPDLIERIVKGRNALVHDSEDREEHIPNGSGLRFLADVLQLVMSVCIAIDLGVDSELREYRLDRTTSWLTELRDSTKWPAELAPDSL